jgi:farnesyl diphosphate synthase
MAASIASGLLSAGRLSLAALASPGVIIRRASRLEDKLKELIRVNGGGRAAGEQTKERFLRAYERLKTELLNDPAFNFDFTDETRQWVAKVYASSPSTLAAQLANVHARPCAVALSFSLS